MTRYKDFNFDTISIKYIFLNNKHGNLIQTQEQNVNIKQGSILYLDNKICLWVNTELKIMTIMKLRQH